MRSELDKKATVSTYKWTLWLLGALTAAPGVINFVQRLFQFGLTPLFAEFVRHYRAIVQALIEILRVREWPIITLVDPWWLQSYFDFLPLSLLAATIVVRAVDIAERRSATPQNALLAVAWVAAMGTTGIGASIAFVMMILLPLLLIQLLGLVLLGDRATVIRDGGRPQPESRLGMIRAIASDNFLFRVSILMWLTFAATASAVVVFCVGNSVSNS